MISRTRSQAELRLLFAHIMLGVMGSAHVIGCGAESTAGTPDAGGAAADAAACLPSVVAENCTPLTAIFPCGYDGGPPTGVGGMLPAEFCAALCNDPQYDTVGSPPAQCALSGPSSQIPPGGQAGVGCEDRQCVAGRKPRGLFRARPERVGHPLAEWLATTAHLEAASVTSFERLEADLARHGAPRALVTRAREAARDEVRHARITARLAKARGATTPRVRVRPVPRPSLAELAVENAVQGCVNETYGALVATWQAAHAQDAAIRAAMARIAVDETRHALLAWSIDAWAQRRLSETERERISRARAKAARVLLRNAGRSEPCPEIVREAGLPPARIARLLCQQLQRLAT